MNEIRKSINAILYERTTSPFYGSLLISWIIWNWRIIYLTFFISENRLNSDKITYIKVNFSDVNQLITFPLISTIILITLIPFVANGAYWLQMNFNHWRITQKNKIEKKQLLTIEQSIELREQIALQEERFEKLLSDKNLQIKQLEEFVLKGRGDGKNGVIFYNENEKELESIAKKISEDKNMSEAYKYLVERMQSKWQVFPEMIPEGMLSMLEVNDIIKYVAKGVYTWGSSGKDFHKIMINDKN